MTQLQQVVDQLQRAFDGDAWSGPSLQEALQDLTAAQAAARPLAGAHSIWELVLHLRTWTDTVRLRLAERRNLPSAAPDWPPVPAQADEAAWARAQQALREAHEQLLAVARTLTDADLTLVLGQARDRADGSGVSVYVLLLGIAQHYLYHAGQVSLLRKLV